MRSNSRPPVAIAALAALVVLPLLAGCSSDDAASSPDTTTGIALATTTTIAPSTTTEAGAEDQLPGLWLSTPEGITDETGDVWAKPRPGETMRSPLSDGIGGVVYLRCTGDQPTCEIEDLPVKGVSPTSMGQADNLLAVGTRQDRRVLLTGWTDPTVVPSFEEDRSGLVARLIDMETREVTPLAGWYGWESSPFAADVEADQFVVCFGEGETCGLTAASDPADLPSIPGLEPETVMSLALDPTGKRLTWVETPPMSGEVKVRVMDLPDGAATTYDLQDDPAPPPDDLVTDGRWVAVRTGNQVALTQLTEAGAADVTGVTGNLTVPDGVTEMALRETGGGGGPGVML